MKHVIVIETPDPPEGKPLTPDIEDFLEGALAITLPTPFYIQRKFNVDSAIAAVHEMYNSKWEPNKQSS